LQHLLGEWLQANGDRAGARQAFESAKAADKAFSPADLALAGVDLAANQLDAARQRLAGVLAADARNLNALFMMAAAEERSGNRVGAISRYRAVLEIDSNNAVAMNNMAYLMALDNPDEALKYAQQALEAMPDTAALQDTLGWVYYRKGMYKTAVNYLKTAVAKEPTPRRQFHLGMCYLKAGDQELGQQTVRAALSQSPDLAKTEQGW
jgi:Tfp pilus assembly protein PilF